MIEEAADAIKLFYAYARKDEVLREDLEMHLLSLSRQKLITTWHANVVNAGTNWEEEIRANLEHATLILILVSADFISSDFCYSLEMQRALERHRAGEVRVIPVILRPCLWQDTPFGELQALPKDGRPVTLWPNRDEVFQDIAKGIRRIILELTEYSPIRSGSQRKSLFPQVWNVPYVRNHFFTGREDILAKLRNDLTQTNSDYATPLRTGGSIGGSGKKTQAQAISGIGGIGKTQIAVEYAYRHRDNYRFVFWVRGSNYDYLLSDFANIADLLRLPERDEQDQRSIIGAVKHWFETHTDWLLILDSVDDIATINSFLPDKATKNGHILLTTRYTTGGNDVNTVDIEKMSLKEGVLLLLRRARLLSDDARLELAADSDRQRAEEIVRIMDGLPLALDQAGAYIEETGIDLSSYLVLYQRRSKELLHSNGSTSHPEGVGTTWGLSFQKVQQENPAAADLLCFCAFFAPDAIPEEILTDAADVLGVNELLLNEAIETLRRYSLIKRDTETKTLSIHRLVQVVLKNDMNGEMQRQWAGRAVRALNKVIPIIDSDLVEEEMSSVAQFQRYLPQALACTKLIKQYDMVFPEAAQLLNRVGDYLQKLGQYQEAEQLLQHALSIWVLVSGSNTVAAAQTISNLAALYQEQKDYARAEPLLVQTLSILGQVVGQDHPVIARNLNNLASLYKYQGRYEEAEPLLWRALTIFEQATDALPLDLIFSLRNLADLYRYQRRSEQAEQLFQYALTICEQELGPKHPETATTLNSLAALYFEQQKYEQAESLFQKSLNIRSQILGPKHLDTIESLYNLAISYTSQGKYRQAEPLFQQSLDICSQELGPEHPATIKSLYSLAVLYYTTGKYTQAEPLLERIIALPEQNLELNTSYVIKALNFLAIFSYVEGRYKKAETLFLRLRVLHEQSTELESLAVAGVLNSLAIISRIQERYQEAEAFFQQALAIREQKAGEHHLDTAQSLIHFAVLYYIQGRFEQAASLYHHALKIYERFLRYGSLEEGDADWFAKNSLLNVSYFETISGLNELGLLLQESGDIEQAHVFFKLMLNMLEFTAASESKRSTDVPSVMWEVQQWLDTITRAMNTVRTSSSRLAYTTAITQAVSLLASAPRQLGELSPVEKILIKHITDRWSGIVTDESRRVGRPEITEEVYSPYIFTTPIRGKRLVGRDDLFRRITSLWAREGQRNSILIYGQRRMGKTSLAQAITQRCKLGSDTEMIYFSVEAVNLEREGYLYYEIAYRMWMLIEERVAEPEINQYIDADAHTTFNKFLARFNNVIESNRLVLVIDEFELLYKYLGQAIATKTIVYLRAQTQAYHWLALAIVGLNDLRDLKRNYNSRLQGWEEMKVSFLSERLVADILSNPPNSPDFPLDYTPKALKFIETLTNGQPFLVQVVGDMLVQRYNHIVFGMRQEHRGMFDIADVQAVVSDPSFYIRAAAYFEGVWGQVIQGSPGEKEILLALAKHEEGLGEDTLREEIGQPATIFMEALNELIHHDILSLMNDRLCYMVPLMQRWMQDVYPRLDKGFAG